MVKVECSDCGKIVRDKPLVGTLHICLLPDEIAARRCALAQMEMQKRAVKDSFWLGSYLR